MAIKIKRPTFYKISAVKEFTDRIESRRDFWNRYTKMVNEGSTIINFYGAGGVGKTALLKKLEEEIKHRDELTHNECKYAAHNFEVSTDMLEVLKTLKFQLSTYGCAFPFFDIGNYYYSLKIGKDVTPPKAMSMLEKIPWVQKMKKNLSKVSNIAGTAMPALRTTKMLFNAATGTSDNLAEIFLKTTIDFLGMSMPVMKTTTTFMSIADSLLMKYLESKGILDDDQKEAREQLNSRREERNPAAIYEYLPALFAMDVTDWMKETNNKLVVFLDNYESLLSVTVLQTTEQSKRDSWLRGNEGLISMLPDTLWVIAGRNKLCWDGELADETEQHLIKALSFEDSNMFLKKANINEENLRGELVRLTKGYPLFLDLCVDVYVEYKRQHDNLAPSISEFGQKREEVIGRIFRYLDADKDDVAKDILEFLCVLNVWTDEIAVDIGGKTLNNFSRNTYKRVKNFSFIQSEIAENEDIKFTVYRYDKTIQSFLFETCDEKLIADVKIAVDEYFKKFFADNRIFNAREIFYLKLWAKFIVRFADNSEKLFKKYKFALRDIVSNLINYAKFDSAEEILQLFINNFEDTNSIYYALIESDFSRLRQTQGRYKEACNMAESAYKKCTRLLGEEHIETVGAMHKLAISLSDSGHFDEAFTLQEKVLSLRKKILGDEHPDTLDAMNNLATSLNDLGRFDEALKLRETVLSLRKKISGDEHPDTVAVMNNLALSLNAAGRHDEAVTLQEKAFKLSKKISGYEHPDTLTAMNNLVVSLNAVSRYDEAVTLQEKVLKLSKKILGYEHPNTLTAMNNLAISLINVGRCEEALNIHEKVFELRKKILGDKNPATIAAMNNLAVSSSMLGCYEKSIKLQTEALKLSRIILGDEHADTLTAMNNLAVSLNSVKRYDESIALQEDILKIYKKIFGEEVPDTLDVMNNLAWTLTVSGRHDEALEIMETALPLYKKILGDEHIDTLGGADTMIHALNGLGRLKESIKLQRDTLSQCEKTFGKNHSLTITFMKNLAKNLFKIGEYEEAEQLIEQIKNIKN